MHTSYLQRKFPARMFEAGEPILELMKNPCIMGELRPSRPITGLDVRGFVHQTFEIIGDPRTMPIEQWTALYKSLWMRIFTQILKQDIESFYVTSLINNVYKPTARRVLEDDKEIGLPPEKVEHLMRYLDDKWGYLFCVWHAVGRKEYTVSNGLMQKLKNTKVKGYPSTEFELPFHSIYIDLQNYDSFGPVEHIEGCVLTRLDTDGGVGTDGNFILFALISEKEDGGLLPSPHIGIRTGDYPLECALEKAQILVEKEYHKPWERLFSYLVNVVLYATMPDAESVLKHYDPTYERLERRIKKQKSPKKREKLKKKLKKASQTGYIHLGGSIKVDRAEEQQTPQGFKGTRRITVRTLVSGHWRNQPCGTGKQETKRIWIEPFWRGPEGAPITQKTHKLQ